MDTQNAGISLTPSVAIKRKKQNFYLELVRRLLKEQPLASAGGIIVLLMLFTGVFAGLLAPYGLAEHHLKDIMKPPSSKYLLGTDQLGRDLLSRVIYGARVSMIVSLSSATMCVAISLIIGLPSGFFGGRFDIVVQRFVDAWMCFPPLFIILTIMAVLGPGIVQVIIVLGVHSGISNSRVIRSAVMGVKENAYVDAALAIGCSTRRTIIRHILPNITAPVIIVFSLVMAYAILAEATISFLGFGVPPPIPSWGGMLSGEGRTFMYKAPWLALWSGVALSVATFGINVLGDGIRDVLDPRLRGGVKRYGQRKSKKR